MYFLFEAVNGFFKKSFLTHLCVCARVCVCTIAEGSQLSTCLYIHVNHQLQWLIFVVDLHVLLVYMQGWVCVSTCACCALPPPSFEIESRSSFLRGVRVSLATVSPDSKDSVSHWLVWLISCGLYAPPPPFLTKQLLLLPKTGRRLIRWWNLSFFKT